MMRILPVIAGGLLLAALAVFADAPSRADRPIAVRLRRPVALALVDGGKHLLAANRDSGTISVVDVAARKVSAEVQVGKKLSHITADAAGKRVLVTDEEAGELVVLAWQGGSLRVVKRLRTEMSPVSVALSHDGERATVACLWPRRLVIFDLSTGASAALDLPFAPRLQLLLPGGSQLLVADSFGGGLALVDVRRRKVEAVCRLPAHNIRGLALDGEGKHVLLAHQVLHRHGRPSPGEIQGGNVIANQVRRLPLDGVLRPSRAPGGEEEIHPLGDIERGAGDPAALVETPDGWLLVAVAGIDELAIGRPRAALWKSVAVGRRPTALVLDAAAGRAYVANTFDDSLSIIDVAARTNIAEIRLGPPAELRSEERGELLFHDARLSFEGWYSCHSCHTDGHTNGRLNDNLTDGTFGTPKRVLSLLGVKDTPPWAWNGKMPDLETQVRQSVTSTMQGPKPSTGQVRDLVAYLRTLAPPPPLATARGTLDPRAADRGRALFNELRCASCHKPPAYTSPKTYDVGLRDEAGESHFNPPSLRGVSQGGPYFHDGRAAQLDDLFRRFRHRLPRDLSDDELSDLLQFLQSL